MTVSRFVKTHALKKKYIEAKSRIYVYRSNLEVVRAFRAKKPVSSNNTGVVGGVTASGIAIFAVASFVLSGQNPSETTAISKPDTTLIAPSNPVEREIVASLSIAPKTSAQPTPEEKLEEEMPEPIELKSVTTVDLVEESGSMEAPKLSLLPKPKDSMPPHEGSHIYLLVVDKVRHEVFVLKEEKNSYKIVNRFSSIFGSKRGDKMKSGDLKTPEGLYRIVSIKEDDDLPAQYGPRAYVLDYPNTLDVKNGKSGYGIWIHGSGLGDKVEPTEGCVELTDNNILNLGWYTTVGTPVYIFPEEFEIPITGTSIAKSIIDPDTLYAIKELSDSPESKKILQAAFSIK